MALAYNQQATTASSINVIAGIWLIISPYIFGFGGTAIALNSVIFGIIIGVLALIRTFTPMTTKWIGWINIVLGLWILISPFVVGFTGMAALWNNIILGIIIIVMAAWSSSASPHTI